MHTEQIHLHQINIAKNKRKKNGSKIDTSPSRKLVRTVEQFQNQSVASSAFETTEDFTKHCNNVVGRQYDNKMDFVVPLQDSTFF